MSNKTKLFLTTLILCLFISLSAIYIGYEIVTHFILVDNDDLTTSSFYLTPSGGKVTSSDSSNANSSLLTNISDVVNENSTEYSYYNEETNSEEINTNLQELVTPSTQITFSYYYKSNGETKFIKQLASKYMYGKNELEFAELFPAWELATFSEAEILLKKTLEISQVTQDTANYLLSTNGEYIAIYNYNGDLTEFNNQENLLDNANLKELTDIYVSPLPLDEQEKLKKGILILGDDNLLKTLEDYAS